MTKRTTKLATGEPPTLTLPADSAPAAIWQPQQIVHKRILDLIPNPRNAKRHSREQIDLLAGSIRTFGFAGVILVDGGGQIVAGHGRWEAAKKAGLPTVPCVVVDHLTPQQCQALGLADNRLAELGETDEEQLDLLLAELDQQGFSIGDLGFDDLDLSTVDPAAAAASEEDAPDPKGNVPATSRRGEIYQLGPHRLMCGDSTSSEDVTALLAGSPIDLLLTDPPYCSGGFQEAGRSAGSIGSTQVKKGGRFDGGIANDKLSSRGYQAMMRRVLEVWESGAAYIFTDWRMWVQLYDLMESSGYGMRNMIVWDKGTPGMGMGWRTQHELVGFGVRQQVKFDNHKAQGNVLKSKRTGNTLHPTQKPVDIIETILDVTDSAVIIGDPFAGSGTTLIACATKGRQFRGMELMPHFCDVIRRRWTHYARTNSIDPGPGALDPA